ncbi:DUF1194 domain-containing protein [Haloferula sargassicola]|uniref:Uncharacterized protein n=1 Tax=Haloferula sargassicola TaxID=490096 RepID=A0ABP9UN20_9BACT
MVDLELALVTDTSGSIDTTEFDLQLDGYAQAFRNSQLHSAISGGLAVSLIYFDSSAGVGIPWTVLTGAADALAFADLLDNFIRPSSGGTNPAAGINLATSEIFGNNIESSRQVIDVSGDGDGDPTADAAARDAALAAGVDVINGLPILDGSTTLEQYYIDNIQGGSGAFTIPADSFADFDAAILSKLGREIGFEVTDAGRLVTSTLRTASVAVARTVTRDVGGRLFRLRTGVMTEPETYSEPAPPYSSKGGMAKGGMAKEPIVMTRTCPWEVYGQVYYSSEDDDAQYRTIRGTAAAIRQLLQDEVSTDTFGGMVGVEYDFNTNWSAGFAVSGANSDIKMRNLGSADVDTVALIPYVSYRRPIGASMGFYADALYAYGMTSYDTIRFPGGARGDTDGDFHNLEFNTGLNMIHGSFVHGPYGQLRWLDGDIDGYSEVGAGALTFQDASYKSLASQLGYQVSYPVKLSAGTLAPQVRVAWEHEFEDDQGSVGGIPLAGTDEDLLVAGVGVGWYQSCGLNVGLDYEARIGGDSESHYVGAKIGYEF